MNIRNTKKNAEAEAEAEAYLTAQVAAWAARAARAEAALTTTQAQQRFRASRIAQTALAAAWAARAEVAHVAGGIMNHKEFYATIGGKGLKCDETNQCSRCGYDQAIHRAFDFESELNPAARTYEELETFIDLAHMLGSVRPYAFKDSREMLPSVRDWGNEFNNLHKDTVWDVDADYLTEIDKFFRAKLASL